MRNYKLLLALAAITFSFFLIAPAKEAKAECEDVDSPEICAQIPGTDFGQDEEKCDNFTPLFGGGNWTCCCNDELTEDQIEVLESRIERGVAETPPADRARVDIIFTPQVSIPYSSFSKGGAYTLRDDTGPIGEYIKAIYNYGVAGVGILAAIMLMLGGIIWLTSAGSSSKVEQAKSIITSSIVGLGLVLTSYLLLKTINPDLVIMKTRKVEAIKERVYMDCCVEGSATNGNAGPIRIEAEVNKEGQAISIIDITKGGAVVVKKGEEISCRIFDENAIECGGTIDPNANKVCWGFKGEYKCDTYGKACGNDKGHCFNGRPDGYFHDKGGPDCPEGQHCFYEGNIRLGNCLSEEEYGPGFCDYNKCLGTANAQWFQDYEREHNSWLGQIVDDFNNAMDTLGLLLDGEAIGDIHCGSWLYCCVEKQAGAMGQAASGAAGSITNN